MFAIERLAVVVQRESVWAWGRCCRQRLDTERGGTLGETLPGRVHGQIRVLGWRQEESVRVMAHGLWLGGCDTAQGSDGALIHKLALQL